MNQATERDAALQDVAANPSNNFQLILDLSIEILRPVPAGKPFISADLYAAVMRRDPNLQPNEKRVMGAVMRQLSKLGWAEMTGRIYSSPKRSHVGDAKEWRRTAKQ